MASTDHDIVVTIHNRPEGVDIGSLVAFLKHLPGLLVYVDTSGIGKLLLNDLKQFHGLNVEPLPKLGNHAPDAKQATPLDPDHVRLYAEHKAGLLKVKELTDETIRLRDKLSDATSHLEDLRTLIRRLD